MAEDGIGKLGRRCQLLELAAEVRTEQLVHGGEHLGARPVVERQREGTLGGLAPFAKDLDVRVAEPVDRLELVTHEEQLRLRRPQKIHDFRLQAVRVLELVHEDRAKAGLLALAQLRLGTEQVTRLELQVLEVERRLAPLRLGVALGEQRQQLLQKRPVARGRLVEGSLLDGRQRLAVRGRTIAAGLEAGQIHQAVGTAVTLEQLEQLGRSPSLGIRRFRITDERRRGGVQLVDPLAELRPWRHGEVELAPGCAQGLVDAREHPPQPVAAVGRKELESLRLVSRAELRQRLGEGFGAKHGRLRLVELAEARVEPGSERIRPEHAEQKPWIVEIQAPSSSRARSCRPRWASAARIRVRSSPAARRV